MKYISAIVFALAICQAFGSGKQAALNSAKASTLQLLASLTGKQLSLCSDAVAATDVLLAAAKSSGDSVPFMAATAEACDDIPEAGADSIIEIVTEMYDALDLEIMVGVAPDVDLAAQVALSWVDQNDKFQVKFINTCPNKIPPPPPRTLCASSYL